jgi:dual specificity phosphatase 12
MQKHKISPQEAFDEVRKYRRINTNQGFEKQLEVYHQMKCPTNVEEHPIYQDWLSSNGIEIQKWQEEMGPRPGWRLN